MGNKYILLANNLSTIIVYENSKVILKLIYSFVRQRPIYLKKGTLFLSDDFIYVRDKDGHFSKEYIIYTNK